MSISREQIRELAEFRDEESCAVSFYYQPSAPRNKAHKEDTILIKDLARDSDAPLEAKEKKDCARDDIERIVRLLRGTAHAMALMAKLCLPALVRTSGVNSKCRPRWAAPSWLSIVIFVSNLWRVCWGRRHCWPSCLSTSIAPASSIFAWENSPSVRIYSIR